MSKKICLIDGSGYIFRAFYGLPSLNAPDGTPVNAVFGFTNMFMRLTSKIKCDYCLVLFDAKRKNFRNEIFEEYKANRKETPEELVPQFPIIRKAVEALNLHFLEMEGYEADDLIATYANLARKKDMEVIVVSADKDLMQLIREGVELYDPMKDKFFTPEDVKEKFGVYPDKVVDVQALAGDSTDNIPGVHGIGPKTAAELVNQYGSMEGVLEHAGEIKQEKRRQLLMENAEAARVSLKLVSLKDDVDVPTDFEAYQCLAPSLEVVRQFITEYGFNSLKNKVDNWVAERCCSLPSAEVNAVFKKPEKAYQLVETEAELKRWCDKISATRLVAIDIATNGSSPWFDKLDGIALATAAGEACYLPLITTTQNFDLFSQSSTSSLSIDVLKKYLTPLFASKSILKIAHNTKQVMHFLARAFNPELAFSSIEDIAVLSYDLFSSEHSHTLEDLSKLYLEEDLPKFEEAIGSGKNKLAFSALEKEIQLEVMATRADYTLRLFEALKPRLLANHKVRIYENFDRPLITPLFEMEKRGILVNAKELQELSRYFDERLRGFEQEIYALAGEEFNVASPKQIGEILFGKLGLKGKKTPSGAWATGADVLEELGAEGNLLAQKILDWRELAKLKGTYTDSLFALLDNDGRIHTTFSQIVANTGRLASNNPNLQNIPIRSEEGKKIRACFIAKEGCKLISADYSQVELRLLAEVADVKALKKAFADGVDIHTATASHVFGIAPENVDANLRRHAKAINFGIVYGISPYGLARQIGVSAAEAKAYIDAYFAQMPEIKAYMDEIIKFAHAHEYVETPFGRKCSVFGINDSNKRIVGNAERAAINAPIQGGAADIIKLAMIKVENELQAQGLKTKMLLQVHDELVFEAPEAEVEQATALIKQIMETAITSEIPFKAEVGIGDNWAQAH